MYVYVYMLYGCIYLGMYIGRWVCMCFHTWMYELIYICMYVNIHLCMYVHTYTYYINARVCMHICIYVFRQTNKNMCTCKYINTYHRNQYVYTSICMSVYLHISICRHTHVYMHAYRNMCMYEHTYIHVSLHTYMHKYTYISIQWRHGGWVDSVWDSECACCRFKSQCCNLADYITSLGKMWTPCLPLPAEGMGAIRHEPLPA